MAFPLFEVGTSQVKHEIQARIFDFQIQVFSKFETALQTNSEKIVYEFSKISGKLEHKLENAVEVVAMDVYKNNLVQEQIKLQKDLLQNRKCFFFLVNNDPPLEDIFTEEGTTWRLISELHKWPSRVNDELEAAEQRHFTDRENIEEKLTERKEAFEKNCIYLDKRIKEVYSWSELNQHKFNLPKIEEYAVEIKLKEDEKEKLIREEQALTGTRPEFTLFNEITRKFDAHYELWTKISGMMNNKQKWNECSMKDIEVDQVELTIKESLKTLQKLQKTFATDEGIQKILTQMS